MSEAPARWSSAATLKENFEKEMPRRVCETCRGVLYMEFKNSNGKVPIS